MWPKACTPGFGNSNIQMWQRRAADLPATIQLHCVKRKTSQHDLASIVHSAERGHNVAESGACTRWVQR